MLLGQNHKLKYQIMASIMIPLFLVFAVIGFMVSHFVYETREEEAIETLKSVSNQSQSSMDLLFKYASSYVKQLSKNKTVTDYINQVDTREEVRTHPNYAKVYNTLISIGDSDKNIFLSWVANEKANFYLDNLNVVPEEDYQVTLRPWYGDAMSNKTIAFTKPYIEWSTKRSVVSAIKTLTLEDGSYGFIVVDFNLSKIDVLAKSLSGEMYMVNDQGEVIYHNTKGFLDSNLSLDMPKGLREFADHHQYEPHVFDKISIEGKSYYVVKETLKTPYWQTYSLIEEDEIITPVRMFILFILALLLIAYGILFMILNAIVTKKLKPVEDLKEYGLKVAAGQLDSPLLDAYQDRVDEMGQLTRAYSTIAQVFRDKNHQLEELADQQYEAIQKQYNHILEKEKIASLGTLVAGVANEIDEPLETSIELAEGIKTAVLECHANLDEGHLSQKQFQESVQLFGQGGRGITDHLNKAAGLIQQFKSISSHQDLQVVDTISLYETLEQVIKSLKPLYHNKPIEVINKIDTSLIMTTYKGPIIQVFNHLLTNALAHGLVDGQGQIEVSSQREGALVRIWFKDNGQGMSEETMRKIFEPFFTMRNKDFSGLGLYIIHNIVNQTLSGTIRVESALNQGTEFTITLPINIKT